MTKTQALFDTWLSAKYPKWMRRVALKIKTKRLILEDRLKCEQPS